METAVSGRVESNDGLNVVEAEVNGAGLGIRWRGFGFQDWWQAGRRCVSMKCSCPLRREMCKLYEL